MATRSPRYPWEDWQEKYLRDFEDKLPRVRIAKMVGRSPQAVRLKLMRMKGECFTQNAAEEADGGVSCETKGGAA